MAKSGDTKHLQLSYRQLAIYPILAVGASMIGFIMIKTGRDAVFFQNNGIFHLPIAYMWIALASIPVAMLHLKAIEHWGTRRTRIGVVLFSALVIAGHIPFISGHNAILMMSLFALVPTVFSAIFAGAWLLAGDLLEGADADLLRWAYSRIGASSMLGGIIGGCLTKMMANAFSPQWIIGSGVLVLVAVAWIIRYGHMQRMQSETLRKSDQADAATLSNSIPSFMARHIALFRQPYVYTLLSISSIATLAALYIDFQFYAMAVLSGSSVHFFANFYIALNAASLVLQLTISPWLQARLGIGNTLQVMPIVLLSSIGILSVAFPAQIRSFVKVAEGGLKSSIHRSIWEQTFLSIEHFQRGAAKTLIDGLFARIAEGVGAFGLYLWLISKESIETIHLNWITWIVIFLLSIWIVFAHRLRKFACIYTTAGEWMYHPPDGCPVVSSLRNNNEQEK